MIELHLIRPYWLLSILPTLLIWWFTWKQQQQFKIWSQAIDAHLLTYLLIGKKQKNRLRPIHMLLAIWCLTAISLAGPTWQKEASPFADDEAGLFVILEVSGTMNATDVQPSRLERAKLKIWDLLEERKGAQTGLIVYSGSAHLVMPLTKDARIIKIMLEDLTPELMPAEGDALLDALSIANSMLNNIGAPGSAVVITDSVSPSQTALLATADYNIPIQFLAVKSELAPLDGGLVQSAEVLNGNITVLAPDPTDVKQIASLAKSKLKSVINESGGDRWRDSGYALLPVIALCMLMWSRRGWVVR